MVYVDAHWSTPVYEEFMSENKELGVHEKFKKAIRVEPILAIRYWSFGFIMQIVP